MISANTRHSYTSIKFSSVTFDEICINWYLVASTNQANNHHHYVDEYIFSNDRKSYFSMRYVRCNNNLDKENNAFVSRCNESANISPHDDENATFSDRYLSRWANKSNLSLDLVDSLRYFSAIHSNSLISKPLDGSNNCSLILPTSLVAEVLPHTYQTN